MSLKVVTQARQKCQQCGEELPDFSRQLFKSNEGLCPRCHMILVNFGIDLDRVEYRDMSTKGRSMMVVPRVEFHAPGAAPKNAIPLNA